MKTIKEIWENIKGYNDLYKISNYGKVFSVKHNKIRKTFLNRNGYEYIDLYIKKTRKRFSVHFLVASTFVEGEETNLEVNHKDGDKTNNCFTNLEWVSRSENQRHQQKLHNTYYRPSHCQNCGKEISKNSVFCADCYHSLQRSKIKHPTKEELIRDIGTMSILKIGKKYNMSDNGIRKRCVRFGIQI